MKYGWNVYETYVKVMIVKHYPTEKKEHSLYLRPGKWKCLGFGCGQAAVFVNVRVWQIGDTWWSSLCTPASWGLGWCFCSFLINMLFCGLSRRSSLSEQVRRKRRMKLVLESITMRWSEAADAAHRLLPLRQRINSAYSSPRPPAPHETR